MFPRARHRRARPVLVAAFVLAAAAVPAQVLLTVEELFAVARSTATGPRPDPGRASALLDRIETEHPASDLAALIRLYRDSGMADAAVIAAIDARLAGAAAIPAPPPAAPPSPAPAAPAGAAAAMPPPAAPGGAAPAPGFAAVVPAPTAPSAAPTSAAPAAPASPPQPLPVPAPPAAPPAAAFEPDEASLRLTREDRREVQGRLNALGHPAGTPDGVLGPRSRAAIAAWQAVTGILPTGFLNAAQLALLREVTAASYPQWLAAQPAPRATRPSRGAQGASNRWRAPNDPCAVRPTDNRGQMRRECDRR